MSELLTLAGCCEKAAGADREIDALVWALVVHGGYEWTVDNILRVPSCGLRIGSIDPGEMQRNFNCWHDAIPAYTSSLDAAMSLVPEGYIAPSVNSTLANPLVAKGGSACVCAPDSAAVPVEAATQALALCAAALKARAATPPIRVDNGEVGK